MIAMGFSPEAVQGPATLQFRLTAFKFSTTYRWFTNCRSADFLFPSEADDAG